MLQFVASMLGSKVQLVPPTGNICGKQNGCADSKIGYRVKQNTSYCDAVVLEIYLNKKFQEPKADFNCESLHTK